MRNRSQSMFVSKGELEERYFIANEKDDSSDEKVEDEQATSTEWTARNEFALVNTLSRLVPKSDTMPYDERLKKIDWKRIAFDQFDEAAVKAKFEELLEKTRTYRLLKEILTDMSNNIFVEQHVPKPKSAYALFFKENQEEIVEKYHKSNAPFLAVAAECYKNLSDEKRALYLQRNLEMKENYKKVIEKFSLDSCRKVKQQPELKGPVREFYVEVYGDGQKVRPTRSVKTEYRMLPRKKRLLYILKWLNVEKGNKLNLCQYENAKKSLSKEEMALLDEYEGKPKIPPNPYTLFTIEVYKNAIDPKPSFTEVRDQWQILSPETKKKYLEEAAELRKEYKIDYQSYINSLPSDRVPTKTDKKRTKRLENVEENKESKNTKNRIDNYFTTKVKIDSNNVSPSKETKLVQEEDTYTKIEHANNEKKKKKKDKKKEAEKTPQFEDDANMDNIGKTEFTTPNKRKHVTAETSEIELTPKKKKKKTLEIESEDVGTSSKVKAKENFINTEMEEAVKVKKSKKKKKKEQVLDMNEANANDDTNNYESQETVTEKLEKLLSLKPPKSCYKYFLEKWYDGPKKQAKSQYKSLSADEKKSIKKKYKRAKKKFLENIQTFANSLSSQELEENAEAIENILQYQSDSSDASAEEN